MTIESPERVLKVGILARNSVCMVCMVWLRFGWSCPPTVTAQIRLLVLAIPHSQTSWYFYLPLVPSVNSESFTASAGWVPHYTEMRLPGTNIVQNLEFSCVTC